MFSLLTFVTYLFASEQGYFSEDVYFSSSNDFPTYLATGNEIVDTSGSPYQTSSLPIGMVEYSENPSDYVQPMVSEFSTFNTNYQAWNQQMNQPMEADFVQMYQPAALYNPLQPEQVDVFAEYEVVPSGQYSASSLQPEYYEYTMQPTTLVQTAVDTNATQGSVMQPNPEQMFMPATLDISSLRAQGYEPAVMVPESMVDQIPMLSEKWNMLVLPPPANPKPIPANPQQIPVNPQQMPVIPQQMTVNPQQMPVIPQQMPVIPQQTPRLIPVIADQKMQSSTTSNQMPIKSDANADQKKTDSKNTKKGDSKKKDSDAESGVPDLLVGLVYLILLV